MERLIHEGPNNELYMICRYEECRTKEEYCPGINTEECQCLQEVLKKLKAYDDTGLLPEQIYELDKMYRKLCEDMNKLKGSSLDAVEMAKVAIAMEQLKEYQKLEKEGLLLRLPFKVGNTVWFVGNEFVNDYEVRRFIVDETGIDCVQIAKEIDGRDYWNGFSIDDIGKTIFLSESEAQEALKRLESEEHGR